jgi:hypothetical protein
MCTLPVDATIFVSPLKDQVTARRLCLTAMIGVLAQQQAERVVLERADGDLAADKRTLFQAVRSAGVEGALRYDHLRASEEPLLWISDAVAWCWSHGGRWREATHPLVRAVLDV